MSMGSAGHILPVGRQPMRYTSSRVSFTIGPLHLLPQRAFFQQEIPLLRCFRQAYLFVFASAGENLDQLSIEI
jgi:hypothetical protein